MPADEKAVNQQALGRSVIATPSQNGSTKVAGGVLDSQLLWFVAQAADEIEPWGRRTKLRDAQLREFIPTESQFASALGVVIAANQGYSWRIEAPERTAAALHQVLEDSDRGAGWQSLVAKLSHDLYTQDYGAYMEIVRSGNSPTGGLLALNHLDAERCYPTGDPLQPVVYQDLKGQYHAMDWWSVAPLLELPTPIEKRPGLQLSAISRLLLAVEIIKNIDIYKKEKTGGRHARALHLVQGVTAQAVEDAMEQARAVADNRGLLRYVTPLIVGSHDPQAAVDVKTLEIAALPDGYDEETTFKHYVAQIAMAFRRDYQDFAPLPGGNLGTSTQSEVLHAKNRGKGPAVFMKLMLWALNQRAFPANAEFQWDEQDLEAEGTEATNAKARAEARKARIESGELTPEMAQQIALEQGDLTQEQYDELQQQAVQPVATPTPVLPEEQNPAGQSGDIMSEGERAAKELLRPSWERPFDY